MKHKESESSPFNRDLSLAKGQSPNLSGSFSDADELAPGSLIVDEQINTVDAWRHEGNGKIPIG